MWLSEKNTTDGSFLSPPGCGRLFREVAWPDSETAGLITSLSQIFYHLKSTLSQDLRTIMQKLLYIALTLF